MIAALVLSGCGRHKTTAPPRVAGVPEDAVWAGGPDGGAWILCKSILNKADEFTCKVYFDSNGEVWASGEYVLRRSVWNPKKGKADFYPVTDAPSHLNFGDFDGRHIYLQSSLVLIPKDEALGSPPQNP
jgi:hypothetical protein